MKREAFWKSWSPVSSMIVLAFRCTTPLLCGRRHQIWVLCKHLRDTLSILPSLHFLCREKRLFVKSPTILFLSILTSSLSQNNSTMQNCSRDLYLLECVHVCRKEHTNWILKSSIFTARKRSCRKVMFLYMYLSAILFTGGGGCLALGLGGVHPQGHTPLDTFHFHMALVMCGDLCYCNCLEHCNLIACFLLFQRTWTLFKSVQWHAHVR